MNVGTLQQFLRSLAPAVRDAGGERAAEELEQAGRGLEPFRSAEFGAFADFLARCAEYARSGAVAGPAAIDLGPLQRALRRLEQARGQLDATGDVEAGRSELVEGQRELREALKVLADSAGLSGTKKNEPAWVEEQLLRARARARARALRELAARVTEPAAFERDDVRSAISHLGAAISADEWKLIAAEFGIKAPGKGKGVSGVEEILSRLTGHRPPRAKPARKGAALDPAEVARRAEELRDLIERSRDSSRVGDRDIEEELARLRSLPAPVLAEIARQAGIEKPGSAKAKILATIMGRLTATRRTMAENEL